MITTSADNCFMRQYSWARNNCRMISTSSGSSIRASTMGRSPEIPWAQSVVISRELALNTSGEGRREESE